MKAGDSPPTPPKRAITDLFNYALDCTLQKNYPVPVALLAEVRTVFPTIAQAEYEIISQQLDAAQRLAADLASEVNKRQLTEQEARERLGRAVP